MTCEQAGDLITRTIGERDASAIDRFRLGLHLRRCPACAEEARRMEEALAFMRTADFGHTPDFTETIMTAVLAEAKGSLKTERDVVSLRNWIRVGIVIALASVLFPVGTDFIWLMHSLGPDFILPISLTLGAVLSAYCGLFISRHLDELSERFGLTHGV